jgi:thiol-disulfide isomerase/thioredoxin
MLRSSLLLSLLLLGASGNQEAIPQEPSSSVITNRPYTLMVGDSAPALTVGRWLKGDPTPKDWRGRVHVVEFWATWCRPCVRGIPHLTELQRRYKDDVTILGVNIWEPTPQAVEPFVQKMGEKMGYAVAMDAVPPMPPGSKEDPLWPMKHGRMSLGWINASGQIGIPRAFIIDRQGRIAWIGEPLEIDAPLARIVEDQWNLKAETARYLARMRNWAKGQPLMGRFAQAKRAKDWTSVLETCDALLELDPSLFASFTASKFRTLLLERKERELAYRYGREAVDHVANNSPGALYEIAWTIVDPENGVEQKDLELALKAASRASKLTQGKETAVLVCLARVYFLRGEKQRAYETQRQAVDRAVGEERSQLRKTLEQYSQR